MKTSTLLVLLALQAAAQDLSRDMIDGIHAYLKRATDASIPGRHPTRERLQHIIGAVNLRADPEGSEVLGRLADTNAYEVFAVRWPVLDGVTAEGLLYRPKGTSGVLVVCLPDADQTPEEFSPARAIASAGAEVLVPALIDRKDTWSGNPKFRMTNQPHREYIYRMAFPVGRHIIGYEVEKAMAAISAYPGKRKIGVWGYGEGGLVALYAAAIDPRIEAAVVSGYFQSRQELWREPIFRNVWSLLRDFGDAEIASLVAPRKLLIETSAGPKWDGPSTADPKRRGGAAGLISPVSAEAARAEAERAKALGANVEVVEDATAPFLKSLGLRPASAVPNVELVAAGPGRMKRQFLELVDYTQKLVRGSAAVRTDQWPSLQSTLPIRIREDVIGDLPRPDIPLNPRVRLNYSGKGWKGYDVTLDVLPGVFAYGVLLVPDGISGRRPVVVAQHGLNGRPQSMFNQRDDTRDFGYYQNIGNRLVDLGFVVYMPQNPYIHDDHFRLIQRLANPLRLSMFSFILAQNERLLDWLETLPYVDAKRIGFYGLSYGGKTALRIPPLDKRYALSICSGDFNEWIVKLTSVDRVWSYMFTQEWELPEWNLAHVANHAEMAMLMAPRPFMVERGHRDGVADDEWVAFEYAKVQRFYDEQGIGDRARIEYFNGPHRIEGKGTIEFLKKYLAWP